MKIRKYGTVTEGTNGELCFNDFVIEGSYMHEPYDDNEVIRLIKQYHWQQLELLDRLYPDIEPTLATRGWRQWRKEKRRT